MNVLHRAQGVHEVNEPGWLVHWLRDATLALPIVLAGVWVGLLLCRRLVDATRQRARARLPGRCSSAVICAATASAALGLANPLHATAFGHHHAVADLPWPLHMARDALAAFTANVMLAARRRRRHGSAGAVAGARRGALDAPGGPRAPAPPCAPASPPC